MYKTILRTLSAFSIVTITASAGFAGGHRSGSHPVAHVDCEVPANLHHRDCKKPVTTQVWKDSFTTAPPASPNTATRTNQFFSSEFELNYYEEEERINLKFDVGSDGTQNLVGTSIFYTTNTNGVFNYYAGIRVGADLGAPIIEAFPAAMWETNLRSFVISSAGVSSYVEEVFDLKVEFLGSSTDENPAGRLSALVQHEGYYHFQIEGEFNDKGVITGAGGAGGITYGHFKRNGQGEMVATDEAVGSLTGIIGERGALGAFHSDGASSSRIRGFAGGFSSEGFSRNRLIVLRACNLDPFKAQCSEDTFDALKEARIELCIQGDNASETARSARPHECHNAVATEGCILNPFQARCTGDTSDFNKHSELAQSNRATFCGDSANSGSAVCTDITVADVCGVNPFGEVCAGNYDKQANARLILCRQDGIVADDLRCVQANPIIDICELTPFEDGCTWGAFDDERKDLITACHDADDCADGVLERPNAATWVNSFKTAGDRQGLGSLPNEDTYDENQPFLKNIESALQPNSGIEVFIYTEHHYNPGTTSYKSLDLSTAKFSIDGTRVSLGGDAEDGVADFRGRDSGQEYDSQYAGYNRYVGIFSTTDLGAPLTTPLDNEPKTARWVGSFSGSQYYSLQDFVLEVNFASQSIEAFIAAPYQVQSLIRGDYDDNGVISGTVASGGFTDNNRVNLIENLWEGNHLTGLIGKEGAVGVYRDGGFVARPADLVVLVVDENTKKTAETFLNETCAADPFHRFCYLSNERKARITLCSTGDNAINTDTSIVNWDCMTDVESDSCIRHPFDEKCKPTATSHYKIARENRSAFCKKTANVAHLFCIGAEQNALCLYNPFHTICSNAIYDNVRKAVCKADSSHTGCTDAHKTLNNNATAITWLSDLYKDRGVVPQTKPDTIRRRNQFLQGTEDGLDNGDVEIWVYFGVTRHGSLNLNTATFDGLELGRDKNDEDRANAAADGLAVFQGNNYKSYVGIFSGTDLGSPLVRPTEEADMTATWYGQFQSVWGNKTEFTLNITFSAKSTDGTVGTLDAFVYGGRGTGYYLLKGTFDDNGVIRGTVGIGHFPNHDLTIGDVSGRSVLTGLIGEEGAVGVFTGQNPGGFVASSKSAADAFDPNVKASDWVRSFDDPPYHGIPWKETQQTRFLQGTETGLYRSYVRNANHQLLTLADVRTDGEVADGVAYMFGNQRSYNHQTESYNPATTHHVAGILSGTYLGAAFPTVPAGADGNAITAIWDGKLGLIANRREIPKRDIKLTVDFTNTKFTIADTKTDDNKHFVSFNGLGWDENGVITGNITYDATPTLQTNGSYAASDGSKSEGTVTGLIGQQGAVGAFKSDGRVTTPYVGGFVAVPEVNYANWVHSFGATGLPSVPTTAPKPKNQFLQNGVATLRGNGFNPVDPASLDGTSITFGGVALSGGEAADGVAFASATRGVGTERANYYYAELSSTTNLGSPLSQTSGRATATGLFRFVNNYAAQRAVDFKLKITFGDGGAGRINAFIPANLASLSNAFFLTGTFNGSGVIKGDIYNNSNLTETTTSAQIDNDPMLRKNHGIIRGLIGQQGAVGAFISDATGSSGYAGGFVADAPQADLSIDYLDWVASSFATPLVSSPTLVVTAPVPTLKNQFLKDGDTSLPSSDFTDEKPGHLNLGTATFGGASLDADGDDTDGVSFFRGTRGGEKYFYAGITSTTNLGAPIIDGTKDGSWKGRLKIVFHDTGVKAVDFNLNVTFGSTISNAAGNIRATIAASDLPINNPFVLTGTFDNKGVIKGMASNLVGGTDNGLMTGLIGQDGAVGAFISNDPGTNGYAGGFVAAPPAEPASP